MKMITLTKKEMELMGIFWDAEEPLSRQEILDRAAERKCSWKPNSIHILLNGLMEKGAVLVAGYYLSSRKLGRTFQAAVSKEEYSLMQVQIALENAQALSGLTPQQVMRRLR